MTDQQLLAQFASTGDELSFAKLVDRHLNWVHSAAVRQVGDQHVADDVAQAVFIALARKAATLSRNRPLSPWLFKATRYACTHALRAASRRRYHEQKAATMTVDQLPAPDDPHWTELAPHLDEQMGRLRASDRQAILLRYFEGRGFVDIGRQLGVTDEAARKRTDRAVERLRRLLNQKTSIDAAAALANLLTSYAVQTASAAFSAKVSPAALAAGSSASGPASALAQAIIHMSKMASLKLAAAVLVGAGLFITGSVLYVRHHKHSPTAALSPVLLGTSSREQPATTAAVRSEAQLAIDAMHANDQALQQVHVVFRLIVATAFEPNEQPDRPRDVDGLTEIQSRFFEGDIGSGGRYSLQCGEIDDPKWNGSQLTEWPDSCRIHVSDGHNMLVYHTGNQSAFVGSVAAHGNSELQDAVQATQMINDWLSNPNRVPDYEQLRSVTAPGEAGQNRSFEESDGNTVIGLTCDPLKGFLASHRTSKMDGELFGDARSTDTFEVMPNVWRARKTVDCEYITRRFILSVQKDAKDPKDHMMNRSTLEVYRATPGKLDETIFNPVVPANAAWVYEVSPDGSYIPKVQPPGQRH